MISSQFKFILPNWIFNSVNNCCIFYDVIRNFDDGFPNLFINNAHDIRGQHVAFLASFSSPGVIFEQISAIFALPKLFIASFTLVLPFFPTGSFERMEEEGDVATAFTMARILSMIPKSRGGPTSIVIYDIHALQVCWSYIKDLVFFSWISIIFINLHWWSCYLSCLSWVAHNIYSNVKWLLYCFVVGINFSLVHYHCLHRPSLEYAIVSLLERNVKGWWAALAWSFMLECCVLLWSNFCNVSDS